MFTSIINALLCKDCNKPPSLRHMKIQSEIWFCSSKARHRATSDQSVSTSFLGIRETPGTSDAEPCVGVLAVLPSICQKSSMFLHITHWQSCLPSKNIMKCSLYTQIFPSSPSRGGNGKTCPSTRTGSHSLPRNSERLSNSPKKKIYQETRTANLDVF